MSAVAFAAPVCQVNGQGVPGDAPSAIKLLRGATQNALALGKRGLLVDVLVESIRREARTYDAAVHGAIVKGLVRSLAPTLGEDCPFINVVVNGSSAALEAAKYLRTGPIVDSGFHIPNSRPSAAVQTGEDNRLDSHEQLPPVEIDLMGTTSFNDRHGALLIVQPPVAGPAADDMRAAVQQAMKRKRPVIVLNHPQRGSIHEITRYAGSLPPELAAFESVFLLAPFAIHAQRTRKDKSVGTERTCVGRFVLQRVYPYGWELWRLKDDKMSHAAPGHTGFSVPPATGLVGFRPAKSPPNEDQRKNYVLCGRWSARPTDEELFDDITKAIGDPKGSSFQG